MFENAVVESSYGNRRALTALASFAGQAALAALLAITPMIWPRVLPKPQFTISIGPLPHAPAPPEKIPALRTRQSHGPTHLFRADLLLPARVPNRLQAIVDEVPTATPAEIGVPGGLGKSDGSGLLDSILRTASAVERPAVERPGAKSAEPKSAAGEVKRIRVSSLDPARLVRFVEPVYPPIAKAARIEGTVELRAVIGIDGRLRELNVISGHPLLRKAAIDAVSQWIYKPPVLNGASVEVVAPIAVIFRLN